MECAAWGDRSLGDARPARRVACEAFRKRSLRAAPATRPVGRRSIPIRWAVAKVAAIEYPSNRYLGPKVRSGPHACEIRRPRMEVIDARLSGVSSAVTYAAGHAELVHRRAHWPISRWSPSHQQFRPVLHSSEVNGPHLPGCRATTATSLAMEPARQRQADQRSAAQKPPYVRRGGAGQALMGNHSLQQKDGQHDGEAERQPGPAHVGVHGAPRAYLTPPPPPC